MTSDASSRDCFLLCIGLVYMFAFGSLFPQIPGLYGVNGVMPVGQTVYEKLTNTKSKTAEAIYLDDPSFVYLMPFEPDVSMEIICIIGAGLALSCCLFQIMRNSISYLFLFLLYLSVFKVGRTFLWFQWDTMLLEAGFLSCLVAPLTSQNRHSKRNLHHRIPWFLVRWLLFRLMFASGVVKLTSKCPTWWALTALNYHYETQCIPTPLAWWAHQLPSIVQQLSVLSTYLIEIILPFFFFSPIRLHRLVAFYGQLLLQILIILTGNYNFFNILTSILCISLIDDRHLAYLKTKLSFNLVNYSVEEEEESKSESPPLYTKVMEALRFALNVAILASSYFIWNKCVYYNSKTKSLRLKFTYDDLDVFLTWSMPVIMRTVSLLFVATVLSLLYSILMDVTHTLGRKLFELAKVSCLLLPCVFMLTISMVTFTHCHHDVAVYPIAQQWYESSSKFDVTHSYGLFRRMTGVGGRPELIIEGGDTPDGPWKEYEFHYKPGSTNQSLPWNFPHQPRLDWQMWFAALGSYQHNPWFVSLLHRLLSNEKEVVDLLKSNPFPDQPPAFIRAQLYHYHYTKLPSSSGETPTEWWTRTMQKTYVPAVSRDSEQLTEFLKYHKLLPMTKRVHRKQKKSRWIIEDYIVYIKQLIAGSPVEYLLWSLAMSVVAVNVLFHKVSDS